VNRTCHSITKRVSCNDVYSLLKERMMRYSILYLKNKNIQTNLLVKFHPSNWTRPFLKYWLLLVLSGSKKWIQIRRKKFKNYTRWVKKKVWLAAPGEKLYLFCALSCMVLSQYIMKIFNFFGIPMATPKNPRTFFSLKFKSSVFKKFQVLIEIIYIHIFAFLNFWFWEKIKFANFFYEPLEYPKNNIF